jgi:hypothetical protein
LDGSFDSFQSGGELCDFFVDVNPANASVMGTRLILFSGELSHLVARLDDFLTRLHHVP